ncbi:hypothetical protein C8J57DRAFT_1511029 [Mycena rebaudengoi]|nr:hypothetical protein C8J57DRAFT_1511029 [Mycena rebaudengoi]
MSLQIFQVPAHIRQASQRSNRITRIEGDPNYRTGTRVRRIQFPNLQEGQFATLTVALVLPIGGLATLPVRNRTTINNVFSVNTQNSDVINRYPAHLSITRADVNQVERRVFSYIISWVQQGRLYPQVRFNVGEAANPVVAQTIDGVNLVQYNGTNQMWEMALHGPTDTQTYTATTPVSHLIAVAAGINALWNRFPNNDFPTPC